MPPRIHKKSPYWHVRGQDDKGRYFESTKLPFEIFRGKVKDPPDSVHEFETKLKEARRLNSALANETKNGAADAPLTLETLEAFFWRGKQSAGISEDMKRTYANNWKQIRRHIKSLDDCNTRAKQEAYVAARKEDKAWGGKSFVTVPTIRKEITVLRFAWQECVEEGVPLPNLPSMPRNLKVEDHVPHAGLRSTAYDIDTLLSVWRQISKQHNRDKFLLAFTTGLRWAELHRLHLVRSFDTCAEQGCAAYFLLPAKATKRNRPRYIGLTHEGLEAWRRLQPFDFVSSRRAFDVARKRVGLPVPITLRDLRASFATGVRDCGLDQMAVDAVMGHALEGSRNNYQHATKERAIEAAKGVSRWLARAKLGGLSVDCPSVVDLRLSR